MLRGQPELFGEVASSPTALRELQIRFSNNFDLTEPVRDAVLAMPESAWAPAITQTGEAREGAAVCELTNLDLSAWPEGTRGDADNRGGPNDGDGNK